MRFLVVTKSRESVPPQMAMSVFEALSVWSKDWQAKGKIEQIWSFAGTPGGGGIVNVESLDELDTMIRSFPMTPFSHIETFGLVDLEPSLERTRELIRAMVPPNE